MSLEKPYLLYYYYSKFTANTQEERLDMKKVFYLLILIYALNILPLLSQNPTAALIAEDDGKPWTYHRTENGIYNC